MDSRAGGGGQLPPADGAGRHGRGGRRAGELRRGRPAAARRHADRRAGRLARLLSQAVRREPGPAGLPGAGRDFDLPEMHTSQFDATPVGLARLFERADVRERVAAQLKPQLDGATRVGFPAVLGLEHSAEAWRDLSDRLGVPVFEIPTLPPSVPGMRLFNAFKAALTQAGVPILLDMTAVRGVVEGSRATGVVVPEVVRDQTYRADTFILATGGLYGGGITSDHTGALREAVFGLPLHTPAGSWMTGSSRSSSVSAGIRSTRPACAPTRRCSRWTSRPRCSGERPHRRPAAGGL